ncbi:MAG: cation diffusion facilitator family transporter [Myxococcota bacterium]
MQPGNRRAILAALAANIGIAVAKFVGWAMTGAASMLAEAVHSLADSGNQALLLWGGASAERPATEEHPFGFARERYFWAFVVSLVIFSLGSLFAIYEGVSKLLHPHELTSPMVAVAILVAGIGMEGVSFRTAVVEATKQKKQLGWWAFIRQTKSPELPVILLEDLGALLGLVVALMGIGLASLTGDPRFDALGSITIGVLLGVIAALLATEMRSLLIGEAATIEDREAIRQSLSQTPSVERVIHMRTQHFGPDQLLVALKVQFEADLTTEGIVDGINDAERRIRERVPAAKLVFIEPDIYRSGEADVGADPS